MNPCRMTLSGETNRGRVRPGNEDNFCIAGEPDAPARLAVVADGLGGHGGGAQASFVCCRSLLQSWRERSGEIEGPRAAEHFLRHALTAANAAVYAFNRGRRGGRPMGCTVAAAVFLPEWVAVANAGDSRVYSYKEGALHQLSMDHTLVEDLRRNGESFDGPDRFGSIITCAVGVRSRLKYDCRSFPRGPEDRFLLCSDGVYRCCPDPLLGAALGEAADAHAAVCTLMRRVFIAGAPDNVTVIAGLPEA